MDMNRRRFINSIASYSLGAGVCMNFPLLEAAPSRKAAAKAVIYLYMDGGMSHIDTFDPKEGTDSQGPVETVKTRTGDRISEFMHYDI